MSFGHARFVMLATSVLSVCLIACGNNEAADGDSTPTSPTSSATTDSNRPTDSTEPTEPTEPTETALGDDSEEMADVLQSAVPTLEGRIQMSEDNDDNDLFGRPAQYDQVTFLSDNRLDCSCQ